MSLFSLLSSAFDEMFAPACAFDPASSGHCPDLMPTVEFHNNFGTLNDFQVPAESDYVFPSSGTDFSTVSSSWDY